MQLVLGNDGIWRNKKDTSTPIEEEDEGEKEESSEEEEGEEEEEEDSADAQRRETKLKKRHEETPIEGEELPPKRRMVEEPQSESYESIISTAIHESLNAQLEEMRKLYDLFNTFVPQFESRMTAVEDRLSTIETLLKSGEGSSHTKNETKSNEKEEDTEKENGEEDDEDNEPKDKGKDSDDDDDDDGNHGFELVARSDTTPTHDSCKGETSKDEQMDEVSLNQELQKILSNVANPTPSHKTEDSSTKEEDAMAAQRKEAMKWFLF